VKLAIPHSLVPHSSPLLNTNQSFCSINGVSNSPFIDQNSQSLLAGSAKTLHLHLQTILCDSPPTRFIYSTCNV